MSDAEWDSDEGEPDAHRFARTPHSRATVHNYDRWTCDCGRTSPLVERIAALVILLRQQGHSATANRVENLLADPPPEPSRGAPYPPT